MSLLAHYIFDNNINSETGSYNGSTAYQITYQPIPAGFNLPGKMAVFTGSSQSRIDLPNIAAFAGAGAKSVSFWAKTTSVGVWQTAFSAGNRTATGNHFVIILEDTVGAGVVVQGHGNDAYAQGLVVNDGVLRHFAVIYPGSGGSNAVQLYMDNVARPMVGNSSANLNTYNGNFGLGRRREANDMFFTGSLANVKIFSHALSQAEVADLYHEGVPPPPPETDGTALLAMMVGT